MTTLSLAGRTWTVGALPARLRGQIDRLAATVAPDTIPDDGALWKIADCVFRAVRTVETIRWDEFSELPFSNAELLDAWGTLT